jgi:hypothetical protein
VGFRYRIDPALGCVFTTLEGTLSDEDILGYVRSALADPEFGPGLRGLVDASSVERLAVTRAGIEGVLDLTRDRDDRIRGARLALVAPQDAAFGMARMYQTLRDDPPYEIQVFRARAEALAWLGLDETQAPRP